MVAIVPCGAVTGKWEAVFGGWRSGWDVGCWGILLYPRYYSSSNVHGDVVALTDANGTTVATYSYA